MRNQHEKFAFVAVLLMKLLLMTLKNKHHQIIKSHFLFSVIDTCSVLCKISLSVDFLRRKHHPHHLYVSETNYCGDIHKKLHVFSFKRL